ncbi:MAG: hypothetical protein HY238_21650, partial [Acidobacteria bacterium]|nr:hypothetical protein [Acidobacteriota bacterium]
MRLLLALALSAALASAQSTHEITTSGTRFLLDGKPFPYTGISFFNAIYNKAFNQSPADRHQWMEKFRRYGINVLRIWAQWDSRRGYADTCDDCTLYYPDGRLREANLARLKQILAGADAEGMVIELTLFAQESWHANIRLGPAEADRAVAAL